jgi:copper chaperone CopZ
MIYKLLSICLLGSLLTLQACSEARAEKQVTFKVYGNCGMCETTIETALEQKGIYLADWDKESKMINVSFDSTKYQLEDIHHLIANAGYDTELERAPDEAYDSLHECCQYERPM